MAKNSDSIHTLCKNDIFFDNLLHIWFGDCHLRPKVKEFATSDTSLLAQICVEFGKLVGAVYLVLEVVGQSFLAFPAPVESSLVYSGLTFKLDEIKFMTFVLQNS